MQLDQNSAAQLARIALDCVHREYPSKIAHVLHSDADVRPPRELTPAFYGCFDWHSAVHGHWTLAKLAGLFPEAPFASNARAALRKSITVKNIRVETAYLTAPGRDSFERPYGLAWLLKLHAELRESDPELAAMLDPLEEAAWTKLHDWIQKLPQPDRSGQHANTAFALGLIIDSATNRSGLIWFDRAARFYAEDRSAPLAFEPSGEDFISPCLAEADLMRRLYTPEKFALWLGGFLPDVSSLVPAISPDRHDGKLAHLDGLNLSRAWMFMGIAAGLPIGDPLRPELLKTSEAHKKAGLASILGPQATGNYHGTHWLATFAVYLCQSPIS